MLLWIFLSTTCGNQMYTFLLSLYYEWKSGSWWLCLSSLHRHCQMAFQHGYKMYTPTSSVREFQFLHMLANTGYLYSFSHSDAMWWSVLHFLFLLFVFILCFLGSRPLLLHAWINDQNRWSRRGWGPVLDNKGPLRIRGPTHQGKAVFRQWAQTWFIQRVPCAAEEGVRCG